MTIAPRNVHIYSQIGGGGGRNTHSQNKEALTIMRTGLKGLLLS